MDKDTEALSLLTDAIASMLCEGVKSLDPLVVAAAHDMNHSYFHGMEEPDLLTIHDRLSGYTKSEKQAAAQLLMFAEREANEFYSDWISGSTGSALPPVIVKNAIFATPLMLKLDVPFREPRKVSKGVYALFASVEDTSFEVFMGRIMLEETTMAEATGVDLSHLLWIGQNVDRLLPFIGQFRLIQSMDREVCESLLNGASGLATGTI